MGGLIGATDGRDLLSIVSRYAPVLGSVLGTPVAGVAISLISNVLGLSTNSVDQIKSTILNDPGAGLKLKELENSHAEELAQIASTDYSVEVDDRKDARKNSTLYKDFMRHMAYLVTIGFFGALLLLFIPVNFGGGQRELLSMLIGMLVSKWQTIIDFFYGSSRPNQSRRIEK